MEDFEAITPRIQTYAVFYDEDSDSINTKPVLWYDRIGEDLFLPAVLCPDGNITIFADDDYRFGSPCMGISLTSNPDINDFEDRIAQYMGTQVVLPGPSEG